MIIDYKDRFNNRCRFFVDENGKYHGLYRYWYSNGKLSYEKNYKNGKGHALCRSWDSNGNLYYEINYKDGK